MIGTAPVGRKKKKEKPACTSLHNAHAQIPHANEVLEQACSTWRWVGGRVAGSRLHLRPDNREELVYVHQRRVLRVSGFTVSWRGGTATGGDPIGGWEASDHCTPPLRAEPRVERPRRVMLRAWVTRPQGAEFWVVGWYRACLDPQVHVKWLVLGIPTRMRTDTAWQKTMTDRAHLGTPQ